MTVRLGSAAGDDNRKIRSDAWTCDKRSGFGAGTFQWLGGRSHGVPRKCTCPKIGKNGNPGEVLEKARAGDLSSVVAVRSITRLTEGSRVENVEAINSQLQNLLTEDVEVLEEGHIYPIVSRAIKIVTSPTEIR